MYMMSASLSFTLRQRFLAVPRVARGCVQLVYLTLSRMEIFILNPDRQAINHRTLHH